MRFFSFHLMPYPDLPPDYDGPAWVTCPNNLFDPKVGHAVYNRYLDELIYAEELGFDGVCINEHHQNAYGIMPSPNLMASILARQTSRVKIAVVGNALPLYDPPTRVAEEFAMIDCISDGRLIAGFVVGGGPEYYSFSINPAHARERFQEAHDIIMKAWTEDGPSEFIGKHYKLRFVNTWPKPVQQPHPEVWIPGAGSLETLEFVARHRYAYMGIPYFHIDVFDRQFRLFREACEAEGYTYDPKQAGWLTPIYVAETDEQARREYEEHWWYFTKRLLPGIEISPPGYTSLRSVENILKGRGSFAMNLETWDQVVEGQYAIVGSPETVYEQLERDILRLGTGNLLGLFQLGTLPADLTRRNLELFASEVMPKLASRFPEGQAIVDARVGGGVMVTTELVQTHVGKVQVRRGGSGAPVVYLHSATGEGEGLLLLDELANSFDVVAPMFPGYGESEGIEQIDDMEDAVFHLLDLFDQLGLTSPAVVGMSLGGWMAAELATRYPERVSRLVLVNSAGLYIQGAEIKDIFGRTPDVLADDMFADQSHPMAQMMKAMGGIAMDEIPFEMIKPFYQTMSATARLAWDPYLHDPKLRKRLHRVTAPTLVVHGKQDTLIPRAHAEAYAAEIPGARLVDVDNAAHLLAIEKPAELADLIRQHQSA